MKRNIERFATRLNRSLLVTLLAVATGIAACAKETADPPKVKVSKEPVNRDTGAPSSYAPVVKRAAPSVVNIYTTRKMTVPRIQMPFDDPFLRRFFGDPYGDGDSQPRIQRQYGLGSGVIVTEDGYILTNNHVVEGADEIKVVRPDDKTEYDAKVVGRDPQTDVAVLKIEARNLPAITLADSDQVEVGDVVLAIGNPLNVGKSVSKGIVSAVGRRTEILGRVGFEDFIQTDAPINQGNSGGALVDIEGRLIGINQSIKSASGASAGVGFAIPINLARSVMDMLVTKGEVARGYLGVNVQGVDADLARAFNLPDQSGALIGGITPDTPAADSDLREGDVIIEVNGKKITDQNHLRLTIAQMPPKTKVNLTILRDGKEKHVAVTLGTLPEELGGGPSRSNQSESQSDSTVLQGLELSELDRRTRDQYDIPPHVRGVVVTNVDPDSAAASAGIRPGDVIMDIGREPVKDVDQAEALVNKSRKEPLMLRVWSKSGGFGGSRYLTIEPAKVG